MSFPVLPLREGFSSIILPFDVTLRLLGMNRHWKFLTQLRIVDSVVSVLSGR